MSMRSSRIVLTLLAASLSVCAAKSQTTFSPKFSPLKQYPQPQNQVQVDLNGDGVPDFINMSEELLSNGNASYTLHEFSGTESAYVPISSGDYNRDGKADVLFYDSSGGNKLFLVGYGDGKGGFSSFDAIPTPPGLATGKAASVVAQSGDFNHDGLPDLAIAYQTNDSSTYTIRLELYLNDGAIFTDEGAVYTYTLPSGATGGVEFDPTPEFDLWLGDFDSDGNADLALRYLLAPPSSPTLDDDNLVVLYGNGGGKFIKTLPVFKNRETDLAVTAADINDDGPTDLVGVANTDHSIHIFRGNTNRTFSETVVSSAATGGTAMNYSIQVADFDGNGLKDIAFTALDTAPNSSDAGVRVLAQTKPGVFALGPYTKVDDFSINSVGEYPFTNGLVGDYNRDMKPDLSLFLSDVAVTHPISLALPLNSGTASYGACAPPALGIHVCAPTTTAGSTSVAFNLSATSFYRLRKMEIWIDGIKKNEAYHVFGTQAYDRATLALTAGTHKVDIYAVAFDESLKLHSSFSVAVK